MPIIDPKTGQVLENPVAGVYPSDVSPGQCVSTRGEDGKPMKLWGRNSEVCNVGGAGELAQLERKAAPAATPLTVASALTPSK